MNFEALVLTPWMAPHTIYHWHRSISASLSGDVYVLARYEETVSAPSITIQIPAVVALRKHLNRSKTDVKFSRHNIYVRDRHTCQYCGNKFTPKHLTFDHVIPRSRGGKTVWTNIVAACHFCNRKKDRCTPQEAGMRLLSTPMRPTSLPLTGPFLLPRDVPELWLPYLEGHQTVAKSA